jgi:hypothetical protein
MYCRHEAWRCPYRSVRKRNETLPQIDYVHELLLSSELPVLNLYQSHMALEGNVD